MMRSVIFSIVIAVLVTFPASIPASGLVADFSLSSSVAVSELQPAPPQKDIDANRDVGIAWYRRPVQLALGSVAILVILLFVVFLTRGGGTTVGDPGFEDRIRSLDAEIKADSKDRRP
jgi:hypothetical protein